MEQKLNLFSKMLKITEELKTVAKNIHVESNYVKYKAVGEVDVLDAVKPLEAKYGIYSYPFQRKIIDNQLIKKQNKAGESVQLMLRIETVYRFVDIDDPSTFIDITSYGDGIDSQDKAPGKAMTYADKYAIMKAYKMSTGDDPDQNASEPNYYNQQQNQTYQAPKKLNSEEVKQALCWAPNIQQWCCQKFNIQTVADLTKDQFDMIMNKLRERGK